MTYINTTILLYVNTYVSYDVHIYTWLGGYYICTLFLHPTIVRNLPGKRMKSGAHIEGVTYTGARRALLWCLVGRLSLREQRVVGGQTW